MNIYLFYTSEQEIFNTSSNDYTDIIACDNK